MPSVRWKTLRRRLVVLCVTCAMVMSAPACRPGDELPVPPSPTYYDAVAAFYTGLAAIQAGAEVIAEEQLLRLSRLVPQEPAAWANLGLLALRRTEFDLAAQRLQQARNLAPDHSQIHLLSGLLASVQGHLEEAKTAFTRAIALAPSNLKALYALAQLSEQQGGAQSIAAAQGLLTQLLSLQPDNLAAQLELARIAAKRADLPVLHSSLAGLIGLASSWEAVAQEQWRAVQAASAEGNTPRVAQHLVILKNILGREAAYRRSLAAMQNPVGQEGEPITHFLRLQSPTSTPAAVDQALTFTVEQLAAPGGPWTWIDAAPGDAAGDPEMILANAQVVRTMTGVPLAFPGGTAALAPAPEGITPLDVNNDARMDLVLAGAGGLALWQQEHDGSGRFTDVSAAMVLPETLTGAPYTGVWAVDLDLEGDLDLLLATPEAAPLGLRNNGDGTFLPLALFTEVRGLRSFAWGDLDADGDPDAVLLDAAGQVQVYTNQRAQPASSSPAASAMVSQFQARLLPPIAAKVLALAIADVDSDSLLDIVLLRADGVMQRLSYTAPSDTWHLVDLAHWPELPTGLTPGQARFLVADMDNNGSLDLIVSTPSGSRVWLGEAQGSFRPLPQALPGGLSRVAALTGDGRLGMLGLSDTGQPFRLLNKGTKNYAWLTLRPRAAPVPGDRRINTFALGGAVDIRAGMLFQKQPITGPLVHFGLGEQRTANVARILWPNGDVQAVFDLASKQIVEAQQRLKGSCPWVFAYDGQTMRFVTDFLWRSPLGLRINAQDTAGVLMTEDWVKLRGDQLVARDGVYDVRITAELWETHFVDYVALLVVDHPVGTHLAVDERFAVPPPVLAVYPTALPRPVAHAWDDQGQEVTETVSAQDGRYLDTFGRGTYQGLTREHYVELDLGEDVPSTGPLWLLASGWIRPTDSSLNLAISQGRHAAPQGVRLEVPDGQGGWLVARADLGFPAGKTKTMLIDLQGLFPPGTPHRLRLWTNLEIYWDAFTWAVGLPDAALKTQRLLPHTATLRYRGFSVVQTASRSAPELPEYQTLAGTAPRWLDLIGYYTRFGEVRELVEAVDDRYVIMNAGDELRLRFAAPDPASAGWQRDFVLIGDGWVKDGDYNTTFSKTVLPLPSHAQAHYTVPPKTLEDDPVYRRHAADWQRYHTRYVTPQRFQEALRTP